MTFESLDQKPLSERIVARILDLIRDKSLKPGEKLPPEVELASMLGVSRPSLREALRALSVMNVVEIRPGTGTFVTSLQPELLVEHLEFVFSLNDSTYAQLFEARKVFEPGIAQIAAQKISDAEIVQLEEIVARSEKSRDDPHEFMMADIELHRTIAIASRNPILLRFMESIGNLGMASRQRTTHLEGVPAQVIIDHRNIIDGFKVHDPDAAYAAMLAHLENIERRLKMLP